jgi:hypothetical protein
MKIINSINTVLQSDRPIIAKKTSTIINIDNSMVHKTVILEKIPIWLILNLMIYGSSW